MYDLMSYQQATEFLLNFGADKDFQFRKDTVSDTFFLSYKDVIEVNDVQILEWMVGFCLETMGKHFDHFWDW